MLWNTRHDCCYPFYIFYPFIFYLSSLFIPLTLSPFIIHTLSLNCTLTNACTHTHSRAAVIHLLLFTYSYFIFHYLSLSLSHSLFHSLTYDFLHPLIWKLLAVYCNTFSLLIHSYLIFISLYSTNTLFLNHTLAQ